jgi:hypothetical protein
MSARRWWIRVLAGAAPLLLAACSIRSSQPAPPVPFLPPPAPPAIQPADLAARLEPPPPIAPGAAGSAPTTLALDASQIEWPGPPPPRRRTVNRLRPRAAEPAKAEEEDEAPEPAPTPPAVPELGQILTDAERDVHQQRIATLAAQTRASLQSLRTRRLTREQQAVVRRIETFVQQAEQLQTQDPVTASSLMERAGLLARDLAARLNK